MTNKIYKPVILALIGGCIYGFLETIFRGYTHWSMVVLGGICFVTIGLINERFKWDTSFIVQMFIGGIIITLLEFITGLIINVWLGWGVWDYSDLWGNILGQICPLYFMIWMCVSAFAIVLDDYLRYWLFHEEKPHYIL